MAGKSNIKKEKQHKKTRDNRGFTLVELIVTLVVLIILLSVSVVGIMAWTEWTEFKKQNEYAQTIFVNAQNQMTEYSVGGKLPVIKEALSSSDGSLSTELTADKLRSMKDEEGSNYNPDTIWKTVATDGEEYKGTICYLSCNKGDYKIYMADKDKAAVDRRLPEHTQLLFEMLENYVYDTSILNAAISVEFSVDDGQIFAVSYSNRNNKFTYDISDSGDAVSICDRTQKARKERMIGFYGVDTMSKAANGRGEKPSITDLKLNNGETLNLSFKLKKSDTAIQRLNYDVGLYDAESGRKRLAFVLDGSKLKNHEHADVVPCKIAKYDEDGNETLLGTFDILAWVNNDRTVNIVLDGADIQATTLLYKKDMAKLGTVSAGDTEFAGTMSFMRFGLDADSIYCTVQGSGAGYKTTAIRQSNTECPMFAAVTRDEESGDTAIDVSNGRHLYNIRYIEDYRDLEYTGAYTFNIKKDIDWEAFAAAGYLKNSGGSGEVADSEFPSFRNLFVDDVINGNDHVITGLTIKESSNALFGIYEGQDVKPAGLFVTNNGTIESLKLDKIKVEGTDSVGAFCGINAGTLKKLETVNTDDESLISGETNVAGITGSQRTKAGEDRDHIVVIKDLTNRASVRGKTYVGGIVGQIFLEKDDYSRTVIKYCRNYGAVYSDTNVRNVSRPYDASYIGGITGCAYNETETPDNLIIYNCISSPQYKDITTAGFAAGTGIKGKLYGCYVGGIVGYNYYGAVVGCSTEAEEDKPGFVFGYKYVGGIIGLNHGVAGGAGENGTDADIKINLPHDEEDADEFIVRSGVNEANVAGYSYVGGIAGSNSETKSGSTTIENGLRVPISAVDLNNKLSRWTNSGIVIASDGYTGGIAGFNTGWIFGCGLHMDETEQIKENDVLTDIHHVGGIAGYNNGVIGNTDRTVNTSGSNSSRKTGTGAAHGVITVTAYVTGGSYVGGITGFNDTDAIIEDYALDGGYVYAAGDFAGGYVGLNLSTEFITTGNDGTVSGTWKVTDGDITGRYFVGAIMGGNILSADTDISTTINYGNMSGNVVADAFAGGIAGYILITDSTYGNSLGIRENMSETEKTETVQWKVESAVDADDLAATVRKLDTVSYPGAAEFTVSGVSGTTVTASEGLKLKGGVYLGGVLGYVTANTEIHIANVTNRASVEAEAAVVNNSEQTVKGTVRKDKDGREYTYSYAGGIIGKVSRNVTLEACSNADDVEILSKGTYTGGLAEINEGGILNCTVPSVDGGASSYIGGICGLNKASGTIKGTIVSDATIKGTSYVGGIVSENFGSLEFDKNVGSITVEASGDLVGGIAGYNAGSIKNTASSGNVEIKGTIKGRKNVGGVTGYMELTGGISGFTNSAEITAENTNAGGITGTYNNNKTSTSAISDCINNGQITSAGAAAGIVAVVSDKMIALKNSTNFGYVKGSVSGGMVALCDSAVSGSMDFEGCINHGRIYGSSYSGGMIASYKDCSSDIETNINDCVNTGIVNGAGIIDNAYGKVYVELCRNYGVSCKAGIAGKEVTGIRSCFDAGSSGVPTGKASSYSGNNFFVTALDTSAVETNGARLLRVEQFYDSASARRYNLYNGTNKTNMVNLKFNAISDEFRWYDSKTDIPKAILNTGSATMNEYRMNTYLEWDKGIVTYLRSEPEDMTLPAPEVTLRMIEGGYLVAVLENAYDYADIESCSINVKLGTGEELIIDGKTGYSTALVKCGTTGNVTISSYAYADGYSQSDTVTREALLVAAGDMDKVFTSENIGFEGGNKDFCYKVRNTNNSDSGMYVTSILSVYDEELGFEVGYSAGAVGIAGHSAAYSYIRNLSEDIDEDAGITIASYLSSGAGGYTSYEYVVADELTADEVKQLKDANCYRAVGGNIKKQTREVYSAVSESMVPGYMVIVNDDGTYRVVYNVWRAGS